MSAAEEQGQGPVIRDRRRIDPVTGEPKAPAAPAASSGAQGDSGAQRQPRPGKHAASRPGPAGGSGSPSPQAEPAGQDADADVKAAASAAPTIEGAGQPAAADDAGPEAAGADLTAALAERTADVQRIQAEYANYRKRVERDRAAVREQALATVIAELLPVLDDIGRAREHGELTGGFKSVAESFEASVTKLGLTAFGEPGEPFDPKVHEALMHSYSPDVTEPTCVQVLLPGYRVGDRILRPARVAVAEPTDPAGARPSGEGAPESVEPAEPAAGPGDPGTKPDEPA